MNRRSLAALTLTSWVTLASAGSFTGSGYFQNFDGLGTSKNLASTPVGSDGWTVWQFPGGSAFDATLWNNSTGIVAGDLSGGNVRTGNMGLYPWSGGAFTDSDGVNADLNAIGIGAVGNRGLGTSPTGTRGSAIQLELVNNSGAGRNSIQLSYSTIILEKSDLNGVRGQSTELLGYRMFYSLSGTSGSWISTPSLDTVTGMDDAIGKTYLTTGTINFAGSWGIGQTLHLRWVDDNAADASPDQMMAIDGVQAVPEPATLLALSAGVLTILKRRRPRTR